MRTARLAAILAAALLLPAAGARGLPVAANSGSIIASIGAGIGLHPDFGSGTWNGGPIVIPITVVDG